MENKFKIILERYRRATAEYEKAKKRFAREVIAETKKIMEAYKLNYREVAEYAVKNGDGKHYSRQYLFQVVNGQQPPTEELIIALARGFGGDD